MIVNVATVPGVGPYGGSGRPLKGCPMLPSHLPLAFRGSFARRTRASSSFARTSPSALLPVSPPRTSRPRGDKSSPARVWTPWVTDRRRRRRTGPCNHTCSWRRRKAPAAGTRSTQDRASASVPSYSPTSPLAFALVQLSSSKRPRSFLGDCFLVTACLPRTHTVALCSSLPSCARSCARSFLYSSCPCSLDPLWCGDGQGSARSVHSTPNPHLVSPIPTSPSPPLIVPYLERPLSKRPRFSLGDSFLVLVCSPRTHAAVLCTRSPGCTIPRALPPFCSSRPRGDRSSLDRVWTPWGGGTRRLPPGPAQPASGPPPPPCRPTCCCLKTLR